MIAQPQDNKHLGGALRRTLESKHSKGTGLRKILDQLTDIQVAGIYLDNEREGREFFVEKQRRQQHAKASTIDCVTHV